MNHNYVIFNTDDGDLPAINSEGYYSICLKDLWDKDYVCINNVGFSRFKGFVGRIIRKVYWIALRKFPQILTLLHGGYFTPNFPESKPICFVCIRYVELPYLQYLKKKFPTAVFIKFERDLISTRQSIYEKYKGADIFDYWVTYDEGDAKRYGMEYFNEIESKIELPEEAYKINYDVFFAARAKKRLPKIIQVYDRLSSQGIKPFFYITNAKPEERVDREGIVYSDKHLTYRQMLIYSCQSKLMLEINQEGAVGYTSRYIEAILYNKRLLTDNMALKNAPYYNPRYIQCFEKIEDIDCSVMMSDEPVDYNYKGEFSPIHMIEFFEKLCKRQK